MGHIARGDFRPLSWAAEYEKRISGAGVRAVADPALPTFKSGSALDNFLYLPGDVAPDTFLREMTVAGEGQQEEMFFYPGDAGPQVEVGNDHPVFVDVPYGAGKKPPRIRELEAGQIRDEERIDRDKLADTFLASPEKEFRQYLPTGNVERAHQQIMRAINFAMQDHFARKPSDRTQKFKDPFARICTDNIQHPKITELEIVYRAGNGRGER